ncbi:MAG TPA: integron integrase, partial [Casimicrobiaceae bacterium]|nr:integron integrase [Casimicrobiaceae bacterium]
MQPPDSPRLLARVRDKVRLKHYSIRTEQAYVDWIKRFIWFHGKRHPGELGAAEVEVFLTDLAVARNVAASTQNQATSALLFLYKDVLGIDLPWLERVERAKAPARLPVVLTRDEVIRVLAELHGVHALIGRLLYGTGMRVMEAMRLRVKDVDFARREILIRDGKGMKDRATVLPGTIVAQMRDQLDLARELYKTDLALGFGAVWLPYALARKFPNAAREWSWQYVFPAEDLSRDPRSGLVRRH